MTRLSLQRMAFLAAVFCVATTMAASAQTFTTLLEFDSTNGVSPFHLSLIQGLNGNLYGTTSGGGAHSCAFGPRCGTIFEVTTAGALVESFSFNGTDGEFPYAGLVQTTNGNLYGTTSSGLTSGGTVFSLTTSGTLTTLHNFCSLTNCADGLNPESTMVLGTDGNFYGTTSNGGPADAGTVFKITAAGTLSTLHMFMGNDGDHPAFGGLVQATDGNFYGTTATGGPNGDGVIFRINAAGKGTILHSFNGTDGITPNGLLQGTDGNFYGTTFMGGAGGGGTVFQITSAGTLTTLYSFCVSGNPCADGVNPGDRLVQATDGNLYGVTPSGGANGSGTIFSISPSGTFSTLYSFSGNDVRPYTTLMQATDGNFYGTSEQGGLLTCGANRAGCGTVFSFSVGLGPFVKTNPGFGRVGWNVLILGTNLTGATGVSFNGTPATTFTVVSPTEIKVIVPTGATTGTIQVTTPSGTLSSNVAFRVLP